MVDLPRAGKDLVEAATSEVDPRELRPTVEAVLDAFDGAKEAARLAAVEAIGAALAKVEGRGAQILCLALGALVEAGASPEAAWPAVGRDLAERLDGATAFATAVVSESGEDDVEAAIEAAGAAVAKKRPKHGDHWKSAPSRCLAAVACLARSKTLRIQARKGDTLVDAAWPLSDVVAEIGALLQALRIADDEELVVLAPEAKRGWRVAIDAMPSNAELYVLLADAILGDAKSGLPGRRPDAKIVAKVRAGEEPGAKTQTVTLPFHLVAWTAVEEDGTLPPGDSDDREHWVWAEGLPTDIQPLGKERIVLLQDAPLPIPTPLVPSFDGLSPELRVLETLPADVVQGYMRRLGQAAAKLRPAPKKAKAKAKASGTQAKKTGTQAESPVPTSAKTGPKDRTAKKVPKKRTQARAQ